jgi:hypothetical protein
MSLLDKFKSSLQVSVKVNTGNTDDFNAPIYEYVSTYYPDCLVAPLSAAEVIESTRPNGAKVSYKVYFTKPIDVRGAKIYIQGMPYDVVGDPKPLIPKSPNDWVMEVLVGKLEG